MLSASETTRVVRELKRKIKRFPLKIGNVKPGIITKKMSGRELKIG